MTHHWKSILDRFRCPDDGSVLRYADDSLTCVSCQRRFQFSRPNLIELLPSQPAPKPPASANMEVYYSEYLKEFERPFSRQEGCVAWGAPEVSSERWMQKRTRQVRRIFPLLESRRDLVLCDFSGGAGHYTFKYAPAFAAVIQCDLSIDNLNYSIDRAERMGVQNILFVRMDYFRPPFLQSLERILCVDSLIRGEWHERLAVAAIARSLKPGGQALIDFHNYMHNPLRRMGFMRQNFVDCKSYRRNQTKSLVAGTATGTKVEFFPFHQEFEPGSLKAALLSPFLPPTRLMYRLTAEPIPKQKTAAATSYQSLSA